VSNDSSRPYNRPNQKWVCGRARQGEPCPEGPSAGGSCKAGPTCRPTKKGDHYKCSRPVQFGGPCSEGPMPDGNCSTAKVPCSPVRSVRHRRLLLTFSTFCISVGLALSLISQSEPNESFFNPGELTSQHKSIKHNCSTCHTSAHGSVIDWVKNPENKIDQSKACLKCHKIENHEFAPHNRDPQVLSPDRTDLGDIACKKCHSEHKGFDNDLKEMGSKKCQTCHEKKFNSFSEGHPPFDGYPFKRNQRINFDHINHFSKHFASTKKTMDCQSCHKLSAGGRVMEIKPYKRTCMGCHNQEVKGSDAPDKGFVFLNLPGIDLDVLKKHGLKIGDWPSETHQPASEFTKLLIQSNADLAKIYGRIEGLDLTDLDEASKKELKDVEAFAWGFKELLFDLIDEESGNFGERLKVIFKKDMSENQIAHLMASLPIDVLKTALRKWMRTLSIEVNQKRRGSTYLTRGTKASRVINEDDEDWMAYGGWYRSDEDYSIKYRPKGHGDGFITSWLVVTGKDLQVKKYSKPVFNMMAYKKGPGKCVKCHSISHRKSGYAKVYWRGRKENIYKKELVKFSHTAHVALVDEKGCISCHQADDRGFKKYDGSKNHRVKGNFANLNKDTCVSCHSVNQVSDGCLTCHNYHTGKLDSARILMKGMKTHLK
jgi:hypothetical protein